MGAVGVRVREDAHLGVAQAVEVLGSGLHADGEGDIVHFL